MISSPAGLERRFVDLAQPMDRARPGAPAPGALGSRAERHDIVSID